MAKDFDRTDYWAPESDLDSVAPGKDYLLPNGQTVNIQINDWVDIDPVGAPDDPFWGSSKQVVELGEDEVSVRMYNADTDLFEPASISVQWILNNYRRVPRS